MELLVSRLRLATGIVLALYVTQHLLNHAFGIGSIEYAEAYRKTVGEIYQSFPGLILLYGSLLFHAAIALRSIYLRSSLRMSAWQWSQILLGLSILPLVVGHAVGNRGFDLLGGIDPDYYQVVTTMLLNPAVLFKLLALIAVVWLHLAIGLHFWLRLKPAYPRFLPLLYALAVLLPVLAYVGIFNMAREAQTWLGDETRLAQIYAARNAMAPDDIRFLAGLEARAWTVMALLLAAVLIARQWRLWNLRRRGSYVISCDDGRRVRAMAGVSLLDALRAARIPHAAVCGGRARCTTCRVRVGNGLEHLPEPNELEQRALQRIGAGKDIRLACQIHPTADIAITPLVMAGAPVASAYHGGGVQGHEEYVVAMFVDMRGSTGLGERVLAYDVVFILNRFFTELSAALQDTGGHYAQFAGDGLMALYGLEPARKQRACADALSGAREMFRRIDNLNQLLQQEFNERVQMGIGIHGGEAIVGTMGPPKTPLLTAVGDNINIAARLEAQTGPLGCDLLVSAETLETAGLEYPLASLRTIELRGRDSPVRVVTYQRGELS